MRDAMDIRPQVHN